MDAIDDSKKMIQTGKVERGRSPALDVGKVAVLFVTWAGAESRLQAGAFWIVMPSRMVQVIAVVLKIAVITTIS